MWSGRLQYHMEIRKKKPLMPCRGTLAGLGLASTSNRGAFQLGDQFSRMKKLTPDAFLSACTLALAQPYVNLTSLSY